MLRFIMAVALSLASAVSMAGTPLGVVGDEPTESEVFISEVFADASTLPVRLLSEEDMHASEGRVAPIVVAKVAVAVAALAAAYIKGRNDGGTTVNVNCNCSQAN